MRTGYNTRLIPLLGLESSSAIARIAFLRVGKLLPPASCLNVGLAGKELTYTSLTGAARQKNTDGEQARRNSPATDCSASLIAQDTRRLLPLSQVNYSRSCPVSDNSGASNSIPIIIITSYGSR